jgi:hypothetical protein
MRSLEASPEADRALRVVLGAFLALTLLYSGGFGNPNELSRYQAVIAAVERGTFEISEELRTLGSHEDVAAVGEKRYSNKAPGLILAAIPVYRILRVFLPAPESGTSPILAALRVLTVSAVSLLALWRFGRRLARGPNPAAAPLVVYAAAFGTGYVFYARSFFSHAWTAALLFLAWDRILAAEEAGTSRRVSIPYLAAGFLAGLAAISEYPVLLMAGLLALRCAARRNGRALTLFVAGLAVPLAALAAYDTMCFGAPWILSSSLEALPEYRELAARGLFGFGLPRRDVALHLLVGPSRGVLLFSPFVLWIVPGFLRWWRSREARPDFWLCLGGLVLFFVAMTAYPNWHGGWALGSRYLLPVLFFAVFPIAWALHSPLSRGLFLAAAVCAAAGHWLLTATYPHWPVWIPWPAVTSAWFLSRGWFAPSLLGGSLSANVAACALAAAAFAAPLVMSARAAAPLSPRPLLCAVLGLAPLALLLLRPPPLPYDARLWRAGMLARYSDRDPSRQELRSVSLLASTPEEQRSVLRAWRVFGPSASP